MVKMTKEEFLEELAKLGIYPTKKQLDQLNQFYKLLIEWNQKLNLTRILTEEEVYLKHFYDSLTIAKVVNLNQIHTLCDVGTGAGFPGIVLKIMFPHLKITLLDALQKRVNYLNEIINQLNLNQIVALHIRGEDYSETFDIVTSRAVANIEKLVTYTMHLTNENGKMIAMKGDIDKELTNDVKAKLSKKYDVLQIEKFDLPKDQGKRSLIVIKNKIKKDM